MEWLDLLHSTLAARTSTQCSQAHGPCSSLGRASLNTPCALTSRGSLEPHNFAAPHPILLLQQSADEVRRCGKSGNLHAPQTHWRREVETVENTTILKTVRPCFFYHTRPAKLLYLMDTTRPWSNMSARIITASYLSLGIIMTGKFLEKSL